MTQEITYNELYEVYNACNQVVTELRQKKLRAHGQFLNFVLTNSDRAYKILVEFEKERPVPGDKMKEYFDKVNELRRSLSRIEGETDEEFKTRQDEMNAKIEELDKEYEEEIKAWNVLGEEFRTKTEKKTKFNSAQLKQAYLPDNMDPDIMEVLHRFITQTE